MPQRKAVAPSLEWMTWDFKNRGVRKSLVTFSSKSNQSYQTFAFSYLNVNAHRQKSTYDPNTKKINSFTIQKAYFACFLPNHFRKPVSKMDFKSFLLKTF